MCDTRSNIRSRKSGAVVLPEGVEPSFTVYQTVVLTLIRWQDVLVRMFKARAQLASRWLRAFLSGSYAQTVGSDRPNFLQPVQWVHRDSNPEGLVKSQLCYAITS